MTDEQILAAIAECYTKYHTKNPRAPMVLGGLSREEQVMIKMLAEAQYLRLVADKGPTPIITKL